MKKLLPIFLFLLAVTAYLTPLYPVYAQGPAFAPIRPNTASSAGTPKPMLYRMEKAMDKMEDKMASRSAALKAKLQKFRDKNKANKVEAINTNLATVNQNATSRMQNHLQQISSIVTKLKTWISEQEASGKDMSAAKNALTTLESDWSEAAASVSAQAGNDYTIAVNSETTVKDDAQASRNKLQNDLSAVHSQLMDLRTSLGNILSSWKGQSNGQ